MYLWRIDFKPLAAAYMNICEEQDEMKRAYSGLRNFYIHSCTYLKWLKAKLSWLYFKLSACIYVYLFTRSSLCLSIYQSISFQLQLWQWYGGAFGITFLLEPADLSAILSICWLRNWKGIHVYTQHLNIFLSSFSSILPFSFSSFCVNPPSLPPPPPSLFLFLLPLLLLLLFFFSTHSSSPLFFIPLYTHLFFLIDNHSNCSGQVKSSSKNGWFLTSLFFQ